MGLGSCTVIQVPDIVCGGGVGSSTTADRGSGTLELEVNFSFSFLVFFRLDYTVDYRLI